MIVGILSDSHGDAAMTRQAVDLLRERGAQALFHCGDICGESVLDALVGHQAWFVWGNCDVPDASMRGYVESIGLPWPSVPVRVELDGRRIAMLHGHEREFDRVARSGDVDYLLFGHTHVFEDRRMDRVRLINPGALHRARVKTVATLNLRTDALTFLTVEGDVIQ
jgi:hypothetical protein